MLKFRKITRPGAFNPDAFDPNRHTWVVPDLKTKHEVQKILLQKHTYLEEDAVLRASELWRKLLKTYAPQIQLVSQSFVSTVLNDYLENKKLSWASSPGSCQMLNQYIEYFLPVLIVQKNHEMLQSWLEQNTSALIKWGKWYHLARESWAYFVEQNLLNPTWVPGFLTKFENLAWHRELYFDLGTQLSAVESDLLVQLQQANSVEVLAPDNEWCSNYSMSLWPYALLQGESFHSQATQTKSFSEVQLSDSVQTQVHRFSTMLSEVKQVCRKVRDLLAEGADPKSIGILAPDIEEYWPCLSEYLRQESVPVEKDIVCSLQSLPELQKWLSRLLIESGDVSSFNLQSELYLNAKKQIIDYEEFKQLFTLVFDEHDLKKSFQVKSHYNLDVKSQNKVSRDEFISWCLKFWTTKDTEAIELLFSRFLQEVPFATKLSVKNWVSYLLRMAAKTELTSVSADPLGVHCDNLSSGRELKVDHLFIIGLSDKALLSKRNIHTSLSESLRISQDLGIQLGPIENPELEFECRWLMQQNLKSLSLSFSMSDFSGAVLGPSVLWLRLALQFGREIEKTTVPALSFWDQLQQSNSELIKEYRRSDEMWHQRLLQRLYTDSGQQAQAKAEVPKDLSFSITQIERYLKCPFIYCAEKLFKLSDLPSLDLDVDHMTRGRVLHAALEMLLSEKLKSEYSDEELLNLISQSIKKEKLKFFDQKTQQSFVNRHLEILKKFIVFENEWRKKFPKTETIGREVKVNAHWDPEAGNFSTSGLKFRGYIDRVDSDGEGHYAVVDYKSAASAGLKNYNKWLENDDLQLAAYSYLIENSFTDIEASRVESAQYLSLKDFNRKGFVLDHKSQLNEVNKRKRNVIDESKKQEVFKSTLARIDQVISAIRSGELAASPKDKNDCYECHWNKICRAPHLN